MNALKLWCTRFLRRMGFSIRKIGHYAQKTKDNVVDFIKEFILYKNKIILEYNLENNEECIGNADETPILLEPVDNKTVDIIGNKDINMITFGKDKERVSVMLTVLGNGEKLPPMIIFKGVENGTRYKSLLKNKYVKSKEIYIGYQVKSWLDENINSHYSSTINNIFKNNKSRYILLPPDLTSVMQPLDLVVNKPFKNNIRFQYRNQLQNRGCKNVKLTPDILIEFIYNAWYKKDIITDEMIRKAFKITGITTKADGSKNHLIKLPEHYAELFYVK